MTIGCNIWMICFILIWFFYGLSHMLQFSQFVWAQRSSVWDVLINFLLKDATDRSKISSDQKRFFIALLLYPHSFFANTPFKNVIFPTSSHKNQLFRFPFTHTIYVPPSSSFFLIAIFFPKKLTKFVFQAGIVELLKLDVELIDNLPFFHFSKHVFSI